MDLDWKHTNRLLLQGISCFFYFIIKSTRKLWSNDFVFYKYTYLSCSSIVYTKYKNKENIEEKHNPFKHFELKQIKSKFVSHDLRRVMSHSAASHNHNKSIHTTFNVKT